MTRARDLADSADKDIAGTLTLDGLTVDGSSSIRHTDATTNISLTPTSTGGVLNVRDSSGNSQIVLDARTTQVGIGTSSPDTKFHVSGGNARIAGTETSGSFIDINASNTGSDGATLGVSYYGSGSYGPLKFSTGGSERMRIDSSGRLLLGTTTAGESSADDLTIATTGQTGITLRSGTANAGAIYFADGTSGTAQYSGYIYYGHSNNALGFATNATERMRIDSSGQVGIGTSSPQQQSGIGLHINNSSGQSRLKLTSSTTGATANDGFDVIVESDTGSPVHLLQHEAGPLKFGTNNAERMRITSGGSVLIGTTSGTGDTANTAAVIGGYFTSKYGVNSIGSTGTWTTVHTFANNAGNFMVSMRASGTGNTSHNSVGVAVIQASGATAFDYIRNGGNVQIRMSGLNLQVWQNVFAGANINWGVTNLGP